MKTTVTKNKVVHDCTSEEQLKRFLAAGWKKVARQSGDKDTVNSIGSGSDDKK